MVANGYAIITDQVQADGVVEGHALLQAGVPLWTSHEIISGGDHDDATFGTFLPFKTRSMGGSPLETIDEGLEASYAAKILETGAKIDQLRLTVVIVQDGEPEVDFSIGLGHCQIRRNCQYHSKH